MKALGIVRRIDDLGRIVIPKEVRRQMRIREGDPLEIFIEDDYVCFKKYESLQQEEWKKIAMIISKVTKSPFVLYDSYGEAKFRYNVSWENCPKIDREDIDNKNIKSIGNYGDIKCYFYCVGNEEKINIAIEILREMFKED